MNSSKTGAIFILIILLGGIAYIDKEHRAAEVVPLDTWAQPIAMAGVPNLHKVSNALYRSAQPTSEGFKNLKALGIETVINLRAFHSDRDEIGDTPLAYERIQMQTWHPEVKQVVRFLQIVTTPESTPVLVHCQHGADRTGTLCAIYRIAVEGWSKEAAITEMVAGGFGFHDTWINLPRWIRALDIDQIREKAGITQRAFPHQAAGN